MPIFNRQSKKIIEEYGIRISPYSKFYLWNNMFFEPCYYRGKKTKTYKPVKDNWRVWKIQDFIKQQENIPKISDEIKNKILSNNKKRYSKKCKKKISRFELMDI